MFQFRGFATVSTCLQHVRLPHSDTYGSRFVCNSPYIFAAYRVLRRLREPRHPPCALGSLPSLCHATFTCDRRFSLNYRFFTTALTQFLSKPRFALFIPLPVLSMNFLLIQLNPKILLNQQRNHPRNRTGLCAPKRAKRSFSLFTSPRSGRQR